LIDIPAGTIYFSINDLYEIKFDSCEVLILISIVVYEPVSIKTLSQGIPNNEHIAYFMAAGVPLQLK
jgi:hypothetical protein